MEHENSVMWKYSRLLRTAGLRVPGQVIQMSPPAGAHSPAS